MPKAINPLESLGWLALALAGLVLALVLGQGGKEWHAAWPYWQQRALSLSLIVILSQGVTAGWYAIGSWSAAAFPAEVEAAPDDYFAWSFCILITLVCLAGWLGVVLEDATGYSRARLPLAVTGVGLSWSAWHAPAWFRYAPVDVVRDVAGPRVARVVYIVVGGLLVAYALFGRMDRLGW